MNPDYYRYHYEQEAYGEPCPHDFQEVLEQRARETAGFERTLDEIQALPETTACPYEELL